MLIFTLTPRLNIKRPHLQDHFEYVMLPCYLQPFSSNSLAWELSFLLASFAKREWWGYSKTHITKHEQLSIHTGAPCFCNQKCKINSAHGWILIFLVEIINPVPSFLHDIHEILHEWLVVCVSVCFSQALEVFHQKW